MRFAFSRGGTFRRVAEAVRCGVVCIVLSALCGHTQARPDETLDPKTYTSPSGEYSVYVEPSSPEGDGAAKYVVKRGGQEVWSGDRLVTLWEAAITDTGIVAGYAYEYGIEGWTSGGAGGLSRLYMVVFDPAGKTIVQEGRNREHPRILSNPPPNYVPLAAGIVVDGANDWFAVRLVSDKGSKGEWWAPFRLSTGEKLAEFEPEQPADGQYRFHRGLECRVVPGTPLVVTQWYTYAGGAPRSNGACVSVLDHAGKELWKLDLPNEYDGLGENWTWHWDLLRPGIVQTGVGPKRFWFHSYSLKAKIEYEVTEDAAAAGGWRVVEVRRDAAEHPQPPSKVGKIESVERPALGVIKLQAEVPGVTSSKLHDLTSFAIGRDGGFAVLRGGASPTLVLVDPKGAVTLERELTDPAVKSALEVAALSDSRWLVYASGLGEGGAGAWTFDPRTPGAGLRRLGEVTVGALREVAMMPEGGFVALTGDDWARADSVTAFDAEGRTRWSVNASMAQDVAVTTDGRVAVLMGIENVIRTYTLAGEPVETIDLKKVLGHAPNYVSGLSADRDGGLLLYDFGGTPPVYRIAKDLAVTQKLTPKYADGRVVSPVRHTAVVSMVDGRVWTCASDGLLRLGDDGIADLAIGDAASGAGRTLRHINALCVRPNGLIYAVNEDDSCVHVFDPGGKLRRVLRPNPDDFVAQFGFGSILVQGNGTVMYTPGAQYQGPGGFVTFNEEGMRTGREKEILNEVSEEWYGLPGTQKRWAVGYTTCGLIDEKGEIAKRLKKRPDGAWFGTLHDAAVSPEGGLAVICGPTGMGMRGPAFACVFSKDGEPIATLPMPEDTTSFRIAFNGTTVAVTAADEVYMLPVTGGAAKKFDLPKDDEKEAWWNLYCSPDGKELWAMRAGTIELVRFAFE